MSFRITGLPAEDFSHLFALDDAELAALGAVRRTAQHGAPCRISLTDATPGDEVILVNYEHHTVDSPYRMRFAIYVRKGEETYDKVDEVPEQLRKRSLAARAFDQDGMMVGFELVEGDEARRRDRAAARRAARRLSARPFRRARLLCGARGTGLTDLERRASPPYIESDDEAADSASRPARRRARPQIAGRRGRPHPRTARSPRARAGTRNDFVCTCGPGDHDTEERSSTSGVALLLSGSFVARDRHGTSLLSEGSLFLVEAGHCFVCSHRHGEGDRCLSFQFEPERVRAHRA